MSNKIDLSKVPQQPGCYLWKDESENIIYVGKSKNLRARMSQYFNNKQNFKNTLLVKNIASFEYITTRSDRESFILETQLIQKYEPKYNVKMKNSSFSPYIVLTNQEEILLRVEKKLKRNHQSSYLKIYGPFPIEYGPYKIIKVLNETFPFNKCLAPNSNKPCLYNQMGMCLGHCYKKVTREDYEPWIKQLDNFFKGDTKFIRDRLKAKIEDYSEKLNFEQAQKLSSMLGLIDNFSNSQKSYFSNQLDADFFAWHLQDKYLSISVSYVRFGKFIKTDNFIEPIEIVEDLETTIETIISQFYQYNKKPEQLILMNELPNQKELLNNVQVPKRGDKKDFIDLTYKDAQKRIDEQLFVLQEKAKRYSNFLSFLKLNMNISKSETFEIVDISSLAGENQVGAVVAYKNNQPQKNLYKKYIINEVEHQDDYASLAEVVYRHFRNKLLKKEALPDVFVVDGGKGQLNIVKDVLNNLGLEKQTLISLKKNNRHKTSSILFYQNTEIMEIKISEMDLSIQDILISMQDEVHRFVIAFNKQRRSKTIFKTSLDNVTFLSKKDIEKLYDNFETIHQMIISNEDDLRKIIGTNKATKLIAYFNDLDK